MQNSNFINAQELAEILEISVGHAYKIIRKFNDELKNQGYVVIAGKISKNFLEEKIYGLKLV